MDITSDAERLRAQSRWAAVGSGLAALLIVGVAALLAHAWRGQMPVKVALHWTSTGYPTRFRPLSGAVVETLILTIILVLIFSGICWQAKVAATRKITAAMSVWVATFPSLLLLSQRGITDPTTARLSPIWLLLSVIPAVVTYLLIPGDMLLPATSAMPPENKRFRVSESQRAAWFRRSVGVRGLLLSSIAVIPILVYAWFSHSVTVAVVAALLVIMLIIDLAVDIQISANGIIVRAIFGWPRTRIPATEIERASVIDVNPLADFGGWGWRLIPGRIGFVTRAGEALLVERTGSRALVISTNDAANAAALLNAFAEQTRRISEPYERSLT